ncbi:hypothetical protein FGB62_166g045 [Gracilaria domingensis]|nr:hypothetical protein FGB62_166g045 [Gracilaria domingensis]
MDFRHAAQYGVWRRVRRVLSADQKRPCCVFHSQSRVCFPMDTDRQLCAAVVHRIHDHSRQRCAAGAAALLGRTAQPAAAGAHGAGPQKKQAGCGVLVAGRGGAAHRGRPRRSKGVASGRMALTNIAPMAHIRIHRLRHRPSVQRRVHRHPRGKRVAAHGAVAARRAAAGQRDGLRVHRDDGRARRAPRRAAVARDAGQRAQRLTDCCAARWRHVERSAPAKKSAARTCVARRALPPAAPPRRARVTYAARARHAVASLPPFARRVRSPPSPRPLRLPRAPAPVVAPLISRRLGVCLPPGLPCGGCFRSCFLSAPRACHVRPSHRLVHRGHSVVQ